MDEIKLWKNKAFDKLIDRAEDNIIADFQSAISARD